MGALEFVGENTVAGAAATTLTLSGLDLNADECYQISVEIDNATGSATTVSLYYNADTTATNYDEQVATAFGASLAAARANNAALIDVIANDTGSYVGTIRKNVEGSRASSVTLAETRPPTSTGTGTYISGARRARMSPA